MKKIIFMVLSLTAASGLIAQEVIVDEDAMFGSSIETSEEDMFGEISSDEDAMFGDSSSDEDAMFGDSSTGSLLVVVADAENADNSTSVLLVSEETTIGGSYSLSTSSSFDTTNEADQFWKESMHSYDIGASLYLDARPTEDFRFFTKGLVDYPATGEGEEMFKLTELFSDFMIGDVYLRGGKQSVNWGVGYFFSPADIISLTAIDPENPDAEREGPVALKAQLPMGNNNLYLYGVMDDLLTSNTMAIAPKAEFLLGNTELGIGGFYQPDKPWAGMLTATSSLYDVSIFGEAVLQHGSSITIAVEDGSLITTDTRDDEYFFMGTLGANFNYTDDDGNFSTMIAAQYYFNGQGYEDPEILKDPQVYMLLSPDSEGLSALSTSDLIGSVRHSAAALLSWNSLLNTDLSLRALWIGNLSDGSGRIDTGLTYSITGGVSISGGALVTYGDDGDLYTPNGSSTTIYINTSIGSGSF